MSPSLDQRIITLAEHVGRLEGKIETYNENQKRIFVALRDINRQHNYLLLGLFTLSGAIIAHTFFGGTLS